MKIFLMLIMILNSFFINNIVAMQQKNLSTLKDSLVVLQQNLLVLEATLMQNKKKEPMSQVDSDREIQTWIKELKLVVFLLMGDVTDLYESDVQQIEKGYSSKRLTMIFDKIKKSLNDILNVLQRLNSAVVHKNTIETIFQPKPSETFTLYKLTWVKLDYFEKMLRNIKQKFFQQGASVEIMSRLDQATQGILETIASIQEELEELKKDYEPKGTCLIS